jgi:hypothetical protein
MCVSGNATVYGDMYESCLSADWWETGKFELEIHPGMGMHIASFPLSNAFWIDEAFLITA